MSDQSIDYAGLARVMFRDMLDLGTPFAFIVSTPMAYYEWDLFDLAESEGRAVEVDHGIMHVGGRP